jgi:hypothetical protein
MAVRKVFSSICRRAHSPSTFLSCESAMVYSARGDTVDNHGRDTACTPGGRTREAQSSAGAGEGCGAVVCERLGAARGAMSTAAGGYGAVVLEHRCGEGQRLEWTLGGGRSPGGDGGAPAAADPHARPAARCAFAATRSGSMRR